MGSLIKAIVIKHVPRKAEAASGSMMLVTLSVAACQCAVLQCCWRVGPSARRGRARVLRWEAWGGQLQQTPSTKVAAPTGMQRMRHR